MDDTADGNDADVHGANDEGKRVQTVNKISTMQCPNLWCRTDTHGDDCSNATDGTHAVADAINDDRYTDKVKTKMQTTVLQHAWKKRDQEVLLMSVCS